MAATGLLGHFTLVFTIVNHLNITEAASLSLGQFLGEHQLLRRLPVAQHKVAARISLGPDSTGKI